MIQQRIFNETNILFNLKGGNKHTDLIIAEAKLSPSTKNIKTQDQKNYFPDDSIIYLKCKWFNINKQNEKIQIQGITGGFYQACFEDIGQKIAVEATPMLEDFQYTGNPLYAEIGPILEDPSTEIETQKLKKLTGQENNKIQILGKLENITKVQNQLLQTPQKQELVNPYNQSLNSPTLYNTKPKFAQTLLKEVEDYEFPKEIILKIDEDICELQIMDLESMEIQKILKVELISNYPKVKMIKKTNNCFELLLNKDIQFRIRAKNNQQRDVISNVINHYMGENKLKRPKTAKKQSQSGESIQDLDIYLSEEIQKQQMQSQLEIQQESQLLNKKRSNTTNQIKNINKNNVQQQNNNGSPSNNNQDTEIMLLVKQRNQELFKNLEVKLVENDQLEKKIKQLQDWKNEKKDYFKQTEEELQELKPKYEKIISERQLFLQDNSQMKMQLKSKQTQIEQLSEQIEQLQQSQSQEKLSQQIQKLKNEIFDYQQQKQIQNDKIHELQVENQNITEKCENLTSEINALKKKCQSLRSESIKLHKQHSRSNSMIQEDNSSIFSGKSTSPKNQFNLQDKFYQGGFASEQNLDGIGGMNKFDVLAQQQQKEIQRLLQLVTVQEQKLVQLRQQYNQQLQENAKKESLEIEQQQNDKSKGFFSNVFQSQNTLPHQNNQTNINQNSGFQNIPYIQKLANSLTENLEEKQLALDNQRKINKQLIQKVLEMEKQMKVLQENSFKQQKQNQQDIQQKNTIEINNKSNQKNNSEQNIQQNNLSNTTKQQNQNNNNSNNINEQLQLQENNNQLQNINQQQQQQQNVQNEKDNVENLKENEQNIIDKQIKEYQKNNNSNLQQNVSNEMVEDEEDAI